MKFDVRDIKAKARKNFQKTWVETAELLPKKSEKDYIGGSGKAHPLHTLLQDVRKIFLSLGFDEIENSIYVPEEEVYWQYGPEAPVILDRCYYLAGLPRPDIGLGSAEIGKIKAINPAIQADVVQKILRNYREGLIEGDNLFEEMTKELGIKTEEAAKIIDIFPEFRNLTAVAEKMTLRSHMTAAWFPTLKALMHKQEMPIRLFCTGLRFRREQKVDATHLRAHYGASCVIMDPDVSLEAGKAVARKVLDRFNFKDLRFEVKKATSNYYAPGTELEIYSGDIEVADCGMYSPVALANYGIEYPVFNIGFGLERILMIRSGQRDIREVLYPQFYRPADLSDRELADHVRIDKSPSTEDGKKLAALITKVGRAHAGADSPCSFPVYCGLFLGRDIEVSIVEKEPKTKLLGPAALNNIFVYQGGIYGVPDDPSSLSNDLFVVKDKGVRVSFGFLEAVSAYFASEIEKSVREGSSGGILQVKMAKTPADINISITEVARRFISSKNKPIYLKGPVFTAVEYKVH